VQSDENGKLQPPSAAELEKKRQEQLQASDTGLWERADAQNPNPARFVPTQLTGFDALHNRRKQQLHAYEDVTRTLNAAQQTLRELEDKRKVAIELRLRHFAERQQLLSHRVLRLYAAIERQHLLRCHGGIEPALAPQEVAWIRRLCELRDEMERKDSGLSLLYDLSMRLQLQSSAAAGGIAGGLPAASHLNLDNIEEWLGRQQQAVRKLIEVSQQDLKDLEILRRHVEAPRA
jgi:hypothetical protein